MSVSGIIHFFLREYRMNGVMHTGMLMVRRYFSCQNLIFFTGSLNKGAIM
jgi:hypothetical protein